MSAGYTTTMGLPWDSAGEADVLYRRVLLATLGLLLVLAVTLPLLPLPELDSQTEVEKQPLTRIVLEKRELPEPEPLEKPKPKERIVKAKPETPVKPKPKIEPVPEPEPVDTLAKARDDAAAAGVLAFRDDLASLRDSVDIDALNQTNTSRGNATAAATKRAILTSKGPSRSSGVNTAKLSTDTGGAALSGRETTAVQSSLAGRPKPGKAKSGAVNVGGRSDEDIRRVMDSNKGAIFALYNRALRAAPLLEGKLVFEMVIHPDGRITELELLSSELADDELTRRILSRINLISFGAKNVLPTRVNYSFDFLPYT